VQHGGYEPGYYASIRLLPREQLGFVALSTTEGLGKLATFELAMSLLREGGVFDAPEPVASASLASARESVLGLLTSFPAAAPRVFDPQSLRFSFLRNLPRDFARMAREHGACRPSGNIVPIGATQGHFELACERGRIEFFVYLTPTKPALLQNVEYREQFPVAETAVAIARDVVAALNGAPLAPTVLQSGSDRAAIEKRLARWHGEYGTCELEAPLSSDGKGQVSFRLHCAEGPLELRLTLDERTSLVRDMTASRPRRYGAVCAE